MDPSTMYWARSGDLSPHQLNADARISSGRITSCFTRMSRYAVSAFTSHKDREILELKACQSKSSIFHLPVRSLTAGAKASRHYCWSCSFCYLRSRRIRALRRLASSSIAWSNARSDLTYAPLQKLRVP